MRCVEEFGRDRRVCRNAVYAARSRLATRRAIFHINSDRAMLDNIAVPSGSGSSDRILAACGIGPFSPGWRIIGCSAPPFDRSQNLCQALANLKTPSFFRAPKRSVNFSDAAGFSERLATSPPIWPVPNPRRAAKRRVFRINKFVMHS